VHLCWAVFRHQGWNGSFLLVWQNLTDTVRPSPKGCHPGSCPCLIPKLVPYSTQKSTSRSPKKPGCETHKGCSPTFHRWDHLRGESVGGHLADIRDRIRFQNNLLENPLSFRAAHCIAFLKGCRRRQREMRDFQKFAMCLMHRIS
jgi:hypothetical protein